MIWLHLLFGLVFTVFAWKQFRLATLLLIATLPSYLIRFTIGPLPSTLLELMFGIVFVVWLLRYSRNDWETLKQFYQSNHWFGYSVALFFIASIASIFVSDMWFYSLGQWRAYILEPIIFFHILLARKSSIATRDIVMALAVSTFVISTIGILQKITGRLYPPALWDDELFGRITSVYTSPNSVGLYLGPIIFLLPLTFQKSKHWKVITVFIGVLALITIILTKSLGAWIALAIGFALYMLLVGYKKFITVLVMITLLITALLPSAHNLLLTKSKSTTNRLALWSYSWEYLTASPKNFIFGSGIRQFFRKIQKPHYEVKELERLIYPHTIVFNFWTELGLFGFLGFAGIFIWLIATSKKIYLYNKQIGAALLTTLAVFLIHGLIDVPYFKNDLAFLFWIIAAIVVLNKKPEPTRVQV